MSAAFVALASVLAAAQRKWFDACMQDPMSVVSPVDVFIAYSHQDAVFRAQLQSHLSALERTGRIRTWHDRRIAAGAEWRREIDAHLQSAQIVLLLVSADFLASDFCYRTEMPAALERRRLGEAVVIPVIVRAVDLSGTPLAELQALPSAASVESFARHDEAFTEVAEGVGKAVNSIIGGRVRQYQAGGRQQWLPQIRIFEAAIADEVPLDESREVTAMIRLQDSEGLQFVLEQDELKGAKERVYSAARRDVRSKPFPLDFPLSNSVIRPPTLVVRVSAPGLDPTEQNKKIFMPTLHDSQPYSFSFRASREGLHVINIELTCDDVVVIEQLLKTHVLEHGGPDGKPPTGGMLVLASVPLKVLCVARGASASA